jgi:hypothetical protein
MTPLLLDLVRAPEHAVDACQVICAGEQGIGVASRDVVFLEMGLLAEVAHLGIVESRDRKRIMFLERKLTSSYTSGATVRLDSNRAWISSCF